MEELPHHGVIALEVGRHSQTTVSVKRHLPVHVVVLDVVDIRQSVRQGPGEAIQFGGIIRQIQGQVLVDGDPGHSRQTSHPDRGVTAVHGGG